MKFVRCPECPDCYPRETDRVANEENRPTLADSRDGARLGSELFRAADAFLDPRTRTR
jgi:hypothetical protein